MSRHAKRFAQAWVVVVGIYAALWPCSTLRAQQYSIADLGTLGGPAAGAFGIGESGVALGFSAKPNANFHAFRWDGNMQDLAPLAGDTQSMAFAFNALGHPLGVSYVMGGLHLHAVTWPAGVPVLLDNFAPHGVNTAGDVVGYTSSSVVGRGWVDRACIFSGSTLTVLSGLGGSNSYANDVDTAGRIVGMSYLADDSTRRACLWLNGQPVNLGTLGGVNSQAYAINDAGQVVGIADNADGVAHAFLYTLGTAGQVLTRVDLGELGGGHSIAYAINNRGEAVGASDAQACYWQSGQVVNLNQRIPAGSGWTLSTASAISDSGQIVGTGFVFGQPRAFLLSPTAPDFDHDGDVDQQDFAHFQLCYTGAGHPQTNAQCQDALLDGDNAVGPNDYLIFQACFSGPGVPADPACWRK